mmetsp:Transcript_53238/g.113774  ORF Transcript_53238/g.113774 Transcript_53238/m.113774 type:complete len:775 (+) Transcript_53238:234-2558(+)
MDFVIAAQDEGTEQGLMVRPLRGASKHQIDDADATRSFEKLKSSILSLRLSANLAPNKFLQLRELRLAENELGDQAVRCFVDAAVLGNVSLTIVELYRNRLGDAAAQALGQLVECSPPPGIRRLHLSHNYFSLGGVCEILASAARSQYYPVQVRDHRKRIQLVPLWLRVEQQQRAWPYSSMRECEKAQAVDHLLRKQLAPRLLTIATSGPNLRRENMYDSDNDDVNDNTYETSQNDEAKAEHLEDQKHNSQDWKWSWDDDWHGDKSKGFGFRISQEVFCTLSDNPRQSQQHASQQGDDWQQKQKWSKGPSCTSECCKHASWNTAPMVHLPYIIHQDVDSEVVPFPAALHRRDREWRSWRPRCSPQEALRRRHILAERSESKNAFPLMDEMRASLRPLPRRRDTNCGGDTIEGKGQALVQQLVQHPPQELVSSTASDPVEAPVQDDAALISESVEDGSVLDPAAGRETNHSVQDLVQDAIQDPTPMLEQEHPPAPTPVHDQDVEFDIFGDLFGNNPNDHDVATESQPEQGLPQPAGAECDEYEGRKERDAVEHRHRENILHQQQKAEEDVAADDPLFDSLIAQMRQRRKLRRSGKEKKSTAAAAAAATATSTATAAATTAATSAATTATTAASKSPKSPDKSPAPPLQPPDCELPDPEEDEWRALAAKLKRRRKPSSSKGKRARSDNSHMPSQGCKEEVVSTSLAAERPATNPSLPTTPPRLTPATGEAASPARLSPSPKTRSSGVFQMKFGRPQPDVVLELDSDSQSSCLEDLD